MLWEIVSYSFAQNIFSWSFVSLDTLFWSLHSGQVDCLPYYPQADFRKTTSVIPVQQSQQPPPTLFLAVEEEEATEFVFSFCTEWEVGGGWGRKQCLPDKTQPIPSFSSWAHYGCDEKGGRSLRTPAHGMHRLILSLPGRIQKLRHRIGL